MPKRSDIQSVLIVGAGPIVIGRLASLTTRALKPVRLLKMRG